jgi:SAM-dependent methyltransferase
MGVATAAMERPAVERSEFDRFADEYIASHKGSLGVTGEEPEYFHRYKIEELVKRYQAKGLPMPSRILDFGCGIGNSIPHLKAAFPAAQITGLDVSQRSLEIAQGRFPDAADYRLYDGTGAPGADHEFDLVFSACVFHHIEAAEHGAIFRRLRNSLSPNGAMAIFEHNPLNPITRYIVASCEFDVNAVLIPSWKLAGLQREAGFKPVDVTYTGFFPASLSALRPIEPLLHGIPLGAQYYTFARP